MKASGLGILRHAEETWETGFGTLQYAEEERRVGFGTLRMPKERGKNCLCALRQVAVQHGKVD